MEIESTNHQDVAEPDQVVSGVAGTGQQDTIETGIDEHGAKENTGRDRIVIGIGVLYNGKTGREALDSILSPKNPVPGWEKNVHETVTPAGPGPEPEEIFGDLIFTTYERQDRTADRLERKISWINRRLTRLEEQKMIKSEERRLEKSGKRGRTE
jgi:hypothetical protein